MEMKLDKDLASIQETRNLIQAASRAKQELATFAQDKIDRIVAAMAAAGERESERLGKMAQEETGFGVATHKMVKNLFASRQVYAYIKDLKTVGIINEDRENRVVEIAVPMGVIAGLIPSTNPTSTVIYKALIAVKAGNAIVFSPHPGAKNCIIEAARVVREAGESEGLPKGAIGCIELPTMDSTAALMKHPDISLILATGGTAMVKAAYSSGTPAIGVGPGNGPAFIERSADIAKAVSRILDSKTFDYGTICASEQSIVTEQCIRDNVVDELKRQGGYFLSEQEKEKVAAVLMRPNGTMNPAIVGKSPETIAKLAGVQIPQGTRVLVAHETEEGGKAPFSKEKLCPVLAFYTEPGWEEACERCIRVLEHEGAGHTMMIHSQDERIIRQFALKKPVNRILVNTPGALGGIGATTNLVPALTLGCGAVGGSSTSDNIGPLHLINIRRLAYGMRELADIAPTGAPTGGNNGGMAYNHSGNAMVEAILRRVVEKLDERK